MRSTTLVVMEQSPFRDYNFRIPEIMAKTWSLTPYQIIGFEEFKEKRRDPSFSFLLQTEVYFEKDRQQTRYNFLSLLLGGNYATVNQMPDICQVPLSYEKADEDSYLYKLPALVLFMQNYVSRSWKDPRSFRLADLEKLKHQEPLPETMELWVLPDEIDPGLQVPGLLEKRYASRVKLKTGEEIAEAIASCKPGVLFLHKVGPEGNPVKARCFKVIMDAEKGRVYYLDYHMIDRKSGDYLLRKDLDKLFHL